MSITELKFTTILKSVQLLAEDPRGELVSLICLTGILTYHPATAMHFLFLLLPPKRGCQKDTPLCFLCKEHWVFNSSLKRKQIEVPAFSYFGVVCD